MLRREDLIKRLSKELPHIPVEKIAIAIDAQISFTKEKLISGEVCSIKWDYFGKFASKEYYDTSRKKLDS